MNNALAAGHSIEFETDKYQRKIVTEPYKIIRSKEQNQGIDNLLEFLESRVIDYETFENDFNLNLPSELAFNKDAESIHELTHIPFDIETNEFQRLCSIGSVNYEARRIIISSFNEDIPVQQIHHIYKYQDWEIAFIEVTNPISNLLLINIETVITATVFSMIMQGESDYQEMIEYLIKDYPLRVDTDLVREMLNHKRKSLVFPHNGKFDVNQLIYFNQKCETFDFINTGKRDFVTLKYGKTKEKHEEYLLPLGNIKAGFRIKLSHSFFYNKFWGTSTFQIYPTQSYSATYCYSTDTGLIASAVQRRHLSLKKLSEKLDIQKYDYQEDKIFSSDQFNSMNEQSYYLILDCLSTLAVYSDLTKDFVFQRFAKIFNFEYQHPFKPFVSSITSGASVPKKNLELHLTNTTKLDIDTIHYNFRQQADKLNFFRAIEEVEIRYNEEKQKYEYLKKAVAHIYQGGKSENQVFYLVETKKGEFILIYDFKNQYPHMARLCNADKQMILAAKGELDKNLVFLRNTSKESKKLLNEYIDRLKVDIKQFQDNIKQLYPIIDDQFLLMNGVIHFKTNEEMYFREKSIKGISEIDRNQDIFATGKFTVHIADFAFSVLEMSQRINKPIDEIFKDHLKIISINYLHFDNIDPFSDELFTKYVQLRDTFPKSDSMNTNLKITGNASYGVFAEGISEPTYKGKLYLPSIPSSITAFARFCTNVVELAAKTTGYGKSLYGDTDSVFLQGKPEELNQIRNLFTIIDPLNFENEKGFNKKGLFLGRKKYHLLGYEAVKINNKYEPNYNKEVSTHKTHGAGSYGRRITEVYEKVSIDILKGLDPQTAINNHVDLFPLSYQVTMKDYNIKRYNNYFKGKIINQFTHKGITIYSIEYDNKLIITTTIREAITGQFFTYFNFKLKNKTNRLFKNHEYIHAKKLINFIGELKDFNEDGFDWYAYSKDERKKFVQFWNKTFENDKITQRMSETEIQAKIENHLDYIYDRELYIELTVIIDNYEEHLEIKSNNDKIKYTNFVFNNFSPIDDEEILQTWIEKMNDLPASQRIKEIYENKEYAHTHLENRFLPKRNQIDIFKTYKRLKDPNSNDLIIKDGYIRNHSDLPITIDTKTYKTDGFNFSLHKKLPELDFSSKLLADQTKYYSQAIINAFSLNASILYAKTHNEEFDKYFDTNPARLPCPKNNTKTSIRLKFKLIPNITTGKILIDEINYNQIVVSYTVDKKKKKDTWLNYLLEKEIVRTLNKKYVKLLDYEKFIDEVNKRIRGKVEFTSMFFINNEWSIEIVSDRSINYNARLECKITVERNRMFFANLHFNPASHKMINLEPYNLKRSQLNEHSNIIRELVNEFLRRTDYIRKFNRKNKLTVKNLEAPNYLDMSYITLAHVVLKQTINKANTKLNEFHITSDLECSNPRLIVTMFEYIIQDLFEKLYLEQTPQNEMTLRNNYYFLRSRQNSGTGIVNRNLFNASIVYAKTYPQVANKVKRVMNKSHISTEHLKYIRDNMKVDDNKIRIETQLKSPKAIEDPFNYQKHNTMVKFMKEFIEIFEEIIKNEDKVTEIKNVVRALNTYDFTFNKILSDLKSIIHEEIKLMKKHKFILPEADRPPPS